MSFDVSTTKVDRCGGRSSLLLIQVGTPPEPIKLKHNDLSKWFADALNLETEQIEVVKVFKGDKLPEPDASRVAVITGSWDMVTDRLPWSEMTAEWIRQSMGLRMPLFGVCYGHQLMAHALGGAVDFHPDGREMGCLEVTLNTAGLNDPLTQHFPTRFYAQLTHMQTVTKVPAGAIVLASSKHDTNQIIRYGPNAISTQFHPEFNVGIAASLINLRAEVLHREKKDPSLMLSQLRDTPEPREILNLFVKNHTVF